MLWWNLEESACRLPYSLFFPEGVTHSSLYPKQQNSATCVQYVYQGAHNIQCQGDVTGRWSYKSHWLTGTTNADLQETQCSALQCLHLHSRPNEHPSQLGKLHISAGNWLPPQFPDTSKGQSGKRHFPSKSKLKPASNTLLLRHPAAPFRHVLMNLDAPMLHTA